MIRWYKCGDCLAQYSKVYDGIPVNPDTCHFCGSTKIKRIYVKYVKKGKGKPKVSLKENPFQIY